MTKRTSKRKLATATVGRGAEYYAYIRSDAWREVKQRYLESRMEKNCFRCLAPYSPLHELHHRTYARLGCEYLTDLALVCRECHQAIHDKEKRAKISVWKATKKASKSKRRKALRENRANGVKFGGIRYRPVDLSERSRPQN